MYWYIDIFSGQDIFKPQVVNIDLSNPIHINMEPDLENMSAQTYYKYPQDEFYNYAWCITMKNFKQNERSAKFF